MPGRPSPKVKARLIEVEPQRRVTWHGNVGADWLFAGDRDFVIVPADGDAVHVTHVENVRGVLFPLFRLFMGSAIQRHHDELNTCLPSDRRSRECPVKGSVSGTADHRSYVCVHAVNQIASLVATLMAFGRPRMLRL